MTFERHEVNALSVAVLKSDSVIITTSADGLQLLGDFYYQGFDGLILEEKHFTPTFFDLKSGLAGEILQKFSNYRMRLVIVGDFSNIESKSLRDFIYESNQGKTVHFVSSVEAALATF